MNPKTLELCKQLAASLVDLCAGQDFEQMQLLGVRGDGKTLVVVCTTDQAAESMLQFLDGQIERGETERIGSDQSG